MPTSFNCPIVMPNRATVIRRSQPSLWTPAPPRGGHAGGLGVFELELGAAELTTEAIAHSRRRMVPPANRNAQQGARVSNNAAVAADEPWNNGSNWPEQGLLILVIQVRSLRAVQPRPCLLRNARLRLLRIGGIIGRRSRSTNDRRRSRRTRAGVCVPISQNCGRCAPRSRRTAGDAYRDAYRACKPIRGAIPTACHCSTAPSSLLQQDVARLKDEDARQHRDIDHAPRLDGVRTQTCSTNCTPSISSRRSKAFADRAFAN